MKCVTLGQNELHMGLKNQGKNEKNSFSFSPHILSLSHFPSCKRIELVIIKFQRVNTPCSHECNHNYWTSLRSELCFTMQRHASLNPLSSSHTSTRKQLLQCVYVPPDATEPWLVYKQSFNIIEPPVFNFKAYLLVREFIEVFLSTL